MFPLYLIIFGIVIHLIFDWFLQPREMAIGKTENWKCMLGHGIIIFAGTMLFYAIAMTPPIHGLLYLWLSLGYTLAHCAQDWIVWTLYKKRVARLNLKPTDDAAFYASVGIDHTLHLSLLFGLASFLL